MGRPRRKRGRRTVKKHSYEDRKRDYPSISTSVRRFSNPFKDNFPFDFGDDLRTFYPTEDRYHDVYGRKIEQNLKRKTRQGKTQRLRGRDYFAVRRPKKTIVCRKRRLRRNILFSKNKVGKGKSIRRPHRFTASSRIGC